MLLALLLAACPPGWAAAPEWLRAAARDTLPSYPATTNAVLLLDEQVTMVGDSGQLKTVHRRAFKILRSDGRSYGTVGVYFDSETALTSLKAWSLPTEGSEYEVKEKDAIETGVASSALYSDKRHKVLVIPAADVGSVVGYEYEQQRRPHLLQDIWAFQLQVPVRRARYILQLPNSWEYRAHWINRAELKPLNVGSNRWVWEISDVEPIVSEPAMPNPESLAAMLGVSLFPRDAAVSGTFASWDDVGRWFGRLAAPQQQVTPQIKQKVAQLTAGAPDLPAKIAALAAFVQNQVRYVAIEIGIGGYQPHLAGDILANSYGDCKDKVTLLAAMLHELGAEPHYVLVNSARTAVHREFPSPIQFDHVILAVRMPAGMAADDWHAVLESKQLGRLLLFDPTSTLDPLGYLPAELQAGEGLLVTDNSGELLRLPLLPPELNRLRRFAEFQLDEDGTLSGKVTESFSGPLATDRRARFLNAAERDRQGIIEHFLSGFLSNFVLLKASTSDLHDTASELVLSYEFRAPDYAKRSGPLLLLRPVALGRKSDPLLEWHPEEGRARKYPVEFSSTSWETDSVSVRLPSGYEVDELPTPLNITHATAEYRSKITVDGTVLRYQREYRIKQVLAPISELPSLKTFYRQIAAEERSAVVLKRIP